MAFKRGNLRYGRTPEPVTPYQKAAQVWDERLGTARVQAKNWRLMAFLSCGLAIGLSGGLVFLASRGLVTPYVVEIERSGAVRNIAPADRTYQPADAQIAYHLARFVEQVRSLSSDAVIVRQNWLKAYDYVTAQAAVTLNDYARGNDPFARVGRATNAVEVTNAVRTSDNSFQLRWQEQSFEGGALTSSKRFTGLFTIVIAPPRDEATLRKNPLGIYITAFSWGQDLGGDGK
jgi:type IV secretion system protein VirB5